MSSSSAVRSSGSSSVSSVYQLLLRHRSSSSSSSSSPLSLEVLTSPSTKTTGSRIRTMGFLAVLTLLLLLHSNSAFRSSWSRSTNVRRKYADDDWLPNPPKPKPIKLPLIHTFIDKSAQRILGTEMSFGKFSNLKLLRSFIAVRPYRHGVLSYHASCRVLDRSQFPGTNDFHFQCNYEPLDLSSFRAIVGPISSQH